MLIVEQPNVWSCLPAAFATVTGIPFETLLEKIGHDGSEIMFPDLKDPFRRQAFHHQELVRVLFELGWIVSTYEFELQAIIDEQHIRDIKYPDKEAYIKKVLFNSFGVICAIVKSTGKYHAVAWDGKQCYDPTGFIYPLSKYDPLMFLRVEKKFY
jgi:hypothetical protein